MGDSVTSRLIRECVKPVGRVTWTDPASGYRDSQMIRPGVDPADLTARRFAHCQPAGLPAGWTVEVVMFPTR